MSTSGEQSGPDRRLAGRRLPGASGRLVIFVRSVFTRVIIDAVREGRPRDVGWPPGLRAVVGASAVIFALGLVLTGGSAVLRQHLGLSNATLRGLDVLPRSVVWLLLFLIIFTLALAQTAALHASWWIRLVITGVSVILLAVWGLRKPSLSYPVVVIAVGVLIATLVALVIIRAKRNFAWWEFPAVFGLLGSVTVLSLIAADRAVANGIDLAPAFLQLTMLSLGQLATPVIFAAGLSVAEVTVSATLWSARIGQRLVDTPTAYVLLGLSVVIWTANATWQVSHWDLVVTNPASIAVSVAVALGFAVVAWVMRRIADRDEVPIRPTVSTLPEVMSKLGLPIGVGVAGFTIVVLLLAVGIAAVLLINPLGSASRSVMSAVGQASGYSPGELIYLGLGAVILIRAFRHARRRQPAVGLLLGCTAVMLIGVSLPVISHDELVVILNLQVINLVAGSALSVTAAVLALRGRLTRQRAVTLTVGLVLSGLFSGSDFVSDPVQAVLGVSGVGLAMFGLSWDLLTGSEWANRDGRRLSVPSRLLLVLANSTLGVTVLAYIALARQRGGPTDPESFSSAGNVILGTALVAAAFVAILGDVRADSEVI